MGKIGRDRRTDRQVGRQADQMFCQQEASAVPSTPLGAGLCSRGEAQGASEESRAEAGREGPQLSFRAGAAGVTVSLE